MIRSNRGKLNPSGIADQKQGSGDQDGNLFSNKAKINAVSSRGLRGNLSPSHAAQMNQYQQDQYNQASGSGVHLPPMPLTPTEQNRREMEKQAKMGTSSINQLNRQQEAKYGKRDDVPGAKPVKMVYKK